MQRHTIHPFPASATRNRGGWSAAARTKAAAFLAPSQASEVPPSYDCRSASFAPGLEPWSWGERQAPSKGGGRSPAPSNFCILPHFSSLTPRRYTQTPIHWLPWAPTLSLFQPSSPCSSSLARVQPSATAPPLPPCIAAPRTTTTGLSSPTTRLFESSVHHNSSLHLWKPPGMLTLLVALPDTVSPPACRAPTTQKWLTTLRLLLHSERTQPSPPTTGG